MAPPFRTLGFAVFLLPCLVVPVAAQVDQARADAFFKEAAAICERDGGRLWGVSLCGPPVGAVGLPGPFRIEGATVSGDGWTVTAASGWAVRPGPRSGDYQIVRDRQ